MPVEPAITVCTTCGAKNRLRTPPAGQLPACGRCGGALPWLLTVQDASFAAEVSAAVPVLVDFWAEWCGPCRLIAPALEELSRELAGKLKVVKVNVDENPVTAGRYRVQSIPTLMVFRDGQPVDTFVGAMPKGQLRARLEPHLQPEAGR
jgi:thioredoxin 2